MKSTLLIAFAWLLLASSKLYAQMGDRSKWTDTAQQIFEWESLKLDSADFSLKPVDLSAILWPRHNYSMMDNMDYFDPNMPILKVPKSFQGALSVKKVPSDYPSNMPILKLMESTESAFPAEIILPKK